MTRNILFIFFLYGVGSGGYAQQLLNNPGFEGSYSAIAPGWTYQAQGSPLPISNFMRDTVNVHSGMSCQRISLAGLDSAGKFFFAQAFTFRRGHIYLGSIWLRAPAGDTVNLNYRRSGPAYDMPVSKTIPAGPAWQKVTVCGGFADSSDVSGTFNINFQTNGQIFMDDASLTDVTDSILNLPLADTLDAIPNQYFGLHLNKWSSPSDSIWPPIRQGMLRLWDSGVKWSDIETSRGVFNWTKLDKYVNDAREHDSTISILYTMGITPFWAASNPYSDTVEFTGSPSPPADINDWIQYIDSVATRYRGKIKYWETWNEVSNVGNSAFYTGSIAEMLALTRTAQQELKRIDSSNIHISPNITAGGIPWMDQFLFKGGAQYFDYLSFHLYPDVAPEDDLPFLTAVHNLADNYSLGGISLFNTEGAVNIGYPDTLQSIGSVSRVFLIHWAFGIKNFNWYCWDISRPAGVSLAVNPLDTTPTAAGIAYRQTANWLQGAVMISKAVDTVSHIWIIEIRQPNGVKAYILWRQDWSSGMFNIPAGWNISTERNLFGDSIPLAGASSVSISGNPILLQSGVPNGLSAFSSEKNVCIYPNPFRSSATLLFHSNGAHMVEIYDLSGRKLSGFICTGASYGLSAEDLSKSLYLVKITEEDGSNSYLKAEVE